MDFDTDIGGPHARFPQTRHSAVRDVCSSDAQTRQRALTTIVETYWKPVYKHVRLKWQADNEEAKDLTQGFFHEALQRGLFDRFDPKRASFRTYMRTCLDGYVGNERKAAGRLKRGGGAAMVSLDFDLAESELQRQSAGADEIASFDREWVRSVFALAIETLRRNCAAAGKSVQFTLFERYDVQRKDDGQPMTYAQLASEFGLPVTTVTNHLAWTRREFRSVLLSTLRQMTASEVEFRDEARLLLGIDPR